MKYTVERQTDSGTVTKVYATKRGDLWLLDFRANDICLHETTWADNPLLKIAELMDKGLADQSVVTAVQGAVAHERWPGMD